MPVSKAQKRIVEKVATWEGVTAEPHRFGGVEFRFGKGSLDTFTVIIKLTSSFL